MKHAPNRAVLYGSINCQSENLGDLIIRRNAIQLLSLNSDSVVLYSAGIEGSFKNAIGIDDKNAYIESYPKYLISLLKSALFYRVTLLLSPGPVIIDAKITSHFRRILIILLSIVVRLRGGRVVAWGRGYRMPTANFGSRLGLHLESLQKKVCTDFYVRDKKSAKLLRSMGQVLPDIAFASEVESLAQFNKREHLASISLRGMNDETRNVLDNVAKLSLSSVKPSVVVTQVVFDRSINAQVSEQYEWAHYDWDGTAHSSQLSIVESCYKNSIFLVSDRLHALIIGALQGSIPVPVDVKNRDKLTSTLEGVITYYDADSMQFLTENPQELRSAQATLRNEVLLAKSLLHNMLRRDTSY